jgi:hypothetical protein
MKPLRLSVDELRLIGYLVKAALLLGGSASVVVVFVLAEGSKGRHCWYCPRCGRWFDWQGRVIRKRPLEARFGFYAEGLCCGCSQSSGAEFDEEGERRFAE